MERVLDVYKRPFDPQYPVVCMDESPKQLIAETRKPIPASPGQSARYDYEYRRCGTCTVFLACEPLAGKRMVKITERRARQDWALFLQDIAGQCQRRCKIPHFRRDKNPHPTTFMQPCEGSGNAEDGGISRDTRSIQSRTEQKSDCPKDWIRP